MSVSPRRDKAFAEPALSLAEGSGATQSRGRAITFTRPALAYRALLWPAAIALVALALRLSILPYINPDPSDGRFDDSVWYNYSARSIAAGEGYDWDPTIWKFPDGSPIYRGDTDTGPSAFWPPAYPAFLAGIYKIAGGSLIAAKVANAVLGAASVVLVYLIARRFLPEAAAALSAAIVALLPSVVLFTTVTVTETAYAFLLLLVIYLTLRWTAPASAVRAPVFILLGMVTGIAALTRGELMLFPIALFAIALAAGRSWRAALVRTVLVVAGMAVVFTPWVVRNRVQMDAWVIGTTGIGRVLLQGHNPEADGKPSLYVPSKFEEQFAHIPRPEREVRANSEEIRAARTWALDHPLEELKLIPQRIFWMYRDDQAGVKWVQGNRPTLSAAADDRLRALSDGCYYALLLLAAIGVVAWAMRRHGFRLLVVSAPIVYSTLMFGVLFIGDDRYHVPLLPFFAILAAAGVAAIARWSAAGVRALRAKGQAA